MTAATIRKPTGFDIAMIVLLGAVWASAFQAMALSVPSFGPVWLVALRVAIGFLVLLPWVLFRGMVWPSSPREWLMVAFLVCVNVLIPFFLLSWAAQIIPSGQLALLMGITPLLGLVLSHFMTHDDKFNLLKLAAVILGFCGISVVVGQSAFEGIGDKLVAQLVTLLSGACYVTSGLVLRKLDRLPPTRLSAMVLGFSALAFLPFSALTQPLPSAPDMTALLALLYLGIFPTGLAYILRMEMIRRVGVSVFSHVGNLIPVFGVVFGAVLLAEPVTLSTVAALLLILTGLGLARAASRPEKALPKPTPPPPQA